MAPFSVFMFALLVSNVDMKSLETNLAIEKRASPACYGSLGCFANEGAFAISLERPLVLLPESPQEVGTVFKLYTREYKTTSQDLQAIHSNNAATTFSHFKTKKTKILVHGFLDNPAITSWQKDLKDEFLKQDDYNVIIVDWSKGNLPPYTRATANTRVVGAQIAELVNTLIKTKGVTAADFHIIGHSLGSHISGYAGERIPGLGRITGLDPAGPYYENTDPVVRLDPSDAVFVDAIHSDSESLIQFGLGMREPVAHLDFYPNLGRDQPGCTRNPFTQIAEWGLVQDLGEPGMAPDDWGESGMTPGDWGESGMTPDDWGESGMTPDDWCESGMTPDDWGESGMTPDDWCESGMTPDDWGESGMTPDDWCESGTAEVVACNHFRAVHFFIESVNTQCPFMGYPCNTEEDFTSGKCNSCGIVGCAYMGLHAERNIPPRGQTRKIYFSTAAHKPFCQYHLDVSVKIAPGTGQTERGQLYAVFTGDKGSTEKILLNESAMDFHVGTLYNFKVGTAKDVGNVQSVTLSFTHVAPLLNPLQWDILGLRDPKLYIQEVDVDRKEANIKYVGS
ncbi:Inactive pancreatic lipase- protein 1 [Bulinus truncatus]|nr:Inactive pancreatic lipase- protein 1 [Bulinus truncatus]